MARKVETQVLADLSAREQALQALASLDGRQWDALRGLAAAHTGGSLSLAGWRAASEAVVSDALRRVQAEGAIGLSSE